MKRLREAYQFVSSPRGGYGYCARAFTVIELITVIGVMALLLALLLPSVNSVRVAADKARARVQFNQWAGAVAGFRSEYGYYPAFDGSHKINGGADAVDHPFHDLLAGRKRDGSALTEGSSAARQNRKAVPFYSFPDADFIRTADDGLGELGNVFGTTDIVVLVDRNLDGVINAADFGDSLPTSNGLQPSNPDFPVTGVRAGVVFYCIAPGATAGAPQFICSWK